MGYGILLVQKNTWRIDRQEGTFFAKLQMTMDGLNLIHPRKTADGRLSFCEHGFFLVKNRVNTKSKPGKDSIEKFVAFFNSNWIQNQLKTQWKRS